MLRDPLSEHRSTACEPCRTGDHNGCWAMTSDHPDDDCACWERDELEQFHDHRVAWSRAMGEL